MSGSYKLVGSQERANIHILYALPLTKAEETIILYRKSKYVVIDELSIAGLGN